jgi:hypothetical protein
MKPDSASVSALWLSDNGFGVHRGSRCGCYFGLEAFGFGLVLLVSLGEGLFLF